MGKDECFEKVREIGEEYGATTGRSRQIDWLDLELVRRAITVNGVNKLVFNKVDILDEVQKWRLYNDFNLLEFKTGRDMQLWIEDQLSEYDIDVMFSGDKEKI